MNTESTIADDDRNDARIWIVQHLAGAVAFAVDQHRIANPGMGIVEGEKVFSWLSPPSQADRQPKAAFPCNGDG